MLTREEVSTLAENIHNGELINWACWTQYPNITPTQAARLGSHIDPIKWPKDYSEGKLPDELRQEIERLTQWLESRSQLWTLNDLVAVLGDDVAPFGMVQAVKAKQQTETVGETGIVKPRKKLKPLERETNEGLLLIYGLCNHLKITYQDELIGIDAWGEIISGKFTSQNIKTYTTKSIVFNSGYKLNKIDFLEKYRKRFAIEE